MGDVLNPQRFQGEWPGHLDGTKLPAIWELEGRKSLELEGRKSLKIISLWKVSHGFPRTARKYGEAARLKDITSLGSWSLFSKLPYLKSQVQIWRAFHQCFYNDKGWLGLGWYLTQLRKVDVDKTDWSPRVSHCNGLEHLMFSQVKSNWKNHTGEKQVRKQE